MVQTIRGRAYRVPDTLPSDTEESVAGTEWHQKSIGMLAGMLRIVDGRWDRRRGVCEQVALQGLQHENGRPYAPRPDVMVLSAPLRDGRLAAVHVEAVGAPLFVAEFAGESTHTNT